MFAITPGAMLVTMVVSAPAPAWLEGCWVTESGQTKEVWQREGDIFFGHNVVLKDGGVRFFEQLRVEGGEGGWSYFAYPRGRGPTVFTEIEQSGASMTFANPQHDFPQRLHYERDGDSLQATASLMNGDKAQRWSYKACAE